MRKLTYNLPQIFFSGQKILLRVTIVLLLIQSNIFAQQDQDAPWKRLQGEYDVLVEGNERCWSCKLGEVEGELETWVLNKKGKPMCRAWVNRTYDPDTDKTVYHYKYYSAILTSCPTDPHDLKIENSGVYADPSGFGQNGHANKEEEKEVEKIEEEIVGRKIIVLSPKSGETIYISKSDKNPKIDIKVKVTDPENGLYQVQLEHNIPGSIQANGISISKGGGKGDGSLKVHGPGKFTFQATALYESSESHVSGLEQKTITVNIKYALSQEEVQKLTDIILELDKMKNEVKNKNENVSKLTPQEFEDRFIEEMKYIDEIKKRVELAELDVKEISKETIEDQKDTYWDPMIKIWNNTHREYENVVNSFYQETEGYKKSLQFLKDRIADPIADIITSTFKWSESKKEVTTSEKEKTLLHFEKTNTHYLQDENSNSSFHKDFSNLKIELKYGTGLIIKDPKKEIFPFEENATENLDISTTGKYSKITSPNTIYEVNVDREKREDIIKVFDGPAFVSSLTNSFEDQKLESNAVMVIDSKGIISNQQLTDNEMRIEGQKFLVALGGINPVDLKSTNGTEREGNQYGDIEIIPYLPTPDESITLLYTPNDDRNQPFTYEWYMDFNNGENKHLGSGNRIQLNPLPAGEYNFRMEIIDEDGDVIYFIAPNLHVIEKEGSSNIQVNPDNNLWETSTYDDIMFYLPYVLGSVGVLGILTFFYRRKSKPLSSSVSNNVQESENKPSLTSTEKKVDSKNFRYCTQCGSRIKAGSKFCSKCGAEMDFS